MLTQNFGCRVLFFSLVSLAVGLAGCEQSTTERASTPTTATGSQASNPAPAPAPVTPPPEMNFANVQAGVDAFKQACASRDEEGINGTMRWLINQREAAVGPLGQLTNDSSAEIGTRVAAARVLALIGTPTATEHLLAASRSDESMVRTKAAESLGSIRPATPPMLDRLLELLDDENQQVQSASIRAIQRLGTQAERAAPKLQAMLNSDAPEQLRQEAHAALKKVAPRVGFRQGELDE